MATNPHHRLVGAPNANVPVPPDPVVFDRWLSRHELQVEFQISVPSEHVGKWARLQHFPFSQTLAGVDVWDESAVREWLRRQQ
jgi:hypothetical protein